MEYNLMNCLSFTDHENDFKTDTTKNIGRGSDSPRSEDECPRSDTPSSDASTSGVCSMVSSDFDACVEDKQFEQERELVIKYLDRDLLDLCSNLYPYSLFQTTSVPKMNMRNYWNLRSVYHRLGPYGNLEEFDHEKCYNCDFYTTVPKKKGVTSQ